MRTFPDASGGRWPISSEGGTQPLWSKVGDELFYRTGKEVISVPIDTGPIFRRGKKRVLFDDRYKWGGSHTNYDIHPDNERFIMIKDLRELTYNITVIMNWTEELKRLVPTGK